MSEGTFCRIEVHMVKTFKNLLLQNRQTDFLETRYVASGTPAHYSCTYDDPGLTLTLFTARSNLLHRLFYRKK